MRVDRILCGRATHKYARLLHNLNCFSENDAWNTFYFSCEIVADNPSTTVGPISTALLQRGCRVVRRATR